MGLCQGEHKLGRQQPRRWPVGCEPCQEPPPLPPCQAAGLRSLSPLHCSFEDLRVHGSWSSLREPAWR